MNTTLLVIDTETGGFDPAEHSILSVGAVVWRNREIVDETEVLVAESPIRADPDAIRVNRIDLKRHAAIGQPPRVAVNTLDAFLQKHFLRERIRLAGQNIGFDISFLQRLYRLGGHDFESRYSHRSIDTASVMGFLILAGLLPIKEASLNAALAYFEIPMSPQSRHTAVADARCTAELLNRLLDLARKFSVGEPL